MIGVAIREARELKGITQRELAQLSFLSDKTISAVETGKRALTLESLDFICNELNDPRVYLESTNKVCNGVFGVQWLDGEAADLHRASVKEKVMEELSEAIRAINSIKTYKNPKICSKEEMEDNRYSIQQAIDAFNATGIYIAVMCRECGFDIKEMFEDNRGKLIQRKYLKGRFER
ncbi:helix-turn-helix domain-containing protein [Clostridium sp. CX1]|uniref:helix-turn-helix domain-containing protein n=1 Tax=Clostridium sp. CX1 TaxID=2978346 RepID=UPI0021C175B3|nr:helix-turn-helix transcriptional regulator [Clostridium sp. CX1]MCT8978684.1 helix-turn-helix domain-containing protein [Clostridium sp. CX1]